MQPFVSEIEFSKRRTSVLAPRHDRRKAAGQRARPAAQTAYGIVKREKDC
jgi:hypothetical protein